LFWNDRVLKLPTNVKKNHDQHFISFSKGLCFCVRLFMYLCIETLKNSFPIFALNVSFWLESTFQRCRHLHWKKEIAAKNFCKCVLIMKRIHSDSTYKCKIFFTNVKVKKKKHFVGLKLLLGLRTLQKSNQIKIKKRLRDA
jgi:hypothetical protein